MSVDQQLGAMQGQVNSLYVTNIPPQISEADLFQVFSEDGANLIQSLRIVRIDDKARYAYLNFGTPDEALQVLTKMNYKEHDGHCITLQKNIKPQSLNAQANLYVSNFSGKVSDKDLNESFSQFGSVVSVRPRSIEANDQVKFVAYVQFETVEAADAALAEVGANGLKLPNGTVEKVAIDRFKPRSAREHSFTNVFVRNFPINFTSDQFKALAERFGRVTSVYLPPTVPNKPGTTAPSQTGFGFANYESASEALQAIEKLNQEVIGDFKLQAFEAKDRQTRRREVDETSAKFKHPNSGHRQQSRYQQRQPTSQLKITHLKPEMTYAHVSEKLSQYGEILQLNKYHDSFVCRFAKPEEAAAARNALLKTWTMSFYYREHGNRHGQPQRRPYGHRQRYQNQRPYRRNYYGYPPYHPAPHHYHPYPPQYGYMQGMPPQGPQRFNTRRNRQNQQNQHQGMMNNQNQQQQMPQQPQGPLSEEERQTLGSQLYYAIDTQVGGNTELTSKITGMLLELPGEDVRALVADAAINPDHLHAKINEARTVLQQQ